MPPQCSGCDWTALLFRNRPHTGLPASSRDRACAVRTVGGLTLPSTAANRLSVWFRPARAAPVMRSSAEPSARLPASPCAPRSPLLLTTPPAAVFVLPSRHLAPDDRRGVRARSGDRVDNIITGLDSATHAPAGDSTEKSQGGRRRHRDRGHDEKPEPGPWRSTERLGAEDQPHGLARDASNQAGESARQDTRPQRAPEPARHLEATAPDPATKYNR